MTLEETPRLLIISFSRLVGDARVLKQIALFRDRYAVATIGYGPAPDGAARHIAIPDELPLWRWPRIPLILKQYRRAYWSNPAIAFARRALSDVAADAVLANDVEAAGLALEIVPGERLHSDLHEYAPRQKEDVPRWRIFVQPFVTWQVRTFVARAGSHSTVGQRIAREYAARFGFTPTVVTNAAPYAECEPTPTGPTIRLVHSGACLADRGIDEIITAVESSSAALTLDLYLTPNDPAYLDSIRARVADSTRVTLHDPVPYAELGATLRRYDVGVHFLPPVNFNNANALPNKLFDFVQARLGIVVGPSPEMAAIVTERGMGAVAGAFTAEALRAVLDALAPTRVDEWKRAVHASARALSAEEAVGPWRDALARILGGPRTNRPRLLIVSFSTLVSDARVLKQIARFRDEYAVTTVGYGPPPTGVVDHIEIPARHPIYRYPKARVLMRDYAGAYWGNAAIAAARDALRGRRFEVALANDVEAAGVALEAVPGSRLHADLHEYAPRQREELRRWRIALAPFVRWMVRRFVSQAASVTTVSGGLARAYRDEFGLPASVVTNASPFIDLPPRSTGSPIRLVHSGAGLANRGIHRMIDAVESSTAEVTLDLYLTRNDPRYMDELRRRCSASSRCTLHDPVPYDELIETLSAYDVGVFVLPPVNFNYLWALPNKLFDFVQARLGIITGPSPEMAAIVSGHSLGAVTADFTAAALQRVLDELEAGTVDEWKRAADRAAHPLSSEGEVEQWARAIGTLTDRGR